VFANSEKGLFVSSLNSLFLFSQTYTWKRTSPNLPFSLPIMPFKKFDYGLRVWGLFSNIGERAK
jgi:hypothetical protein